MNNLPVPSPASHRGKETAQTTHLLPDIRPTKMLSKTWRLAGLLCLTFFLRGANAIEDDEKIHVVTYGSTIKLEHVASAHRLHSHDISYGTGSGQQSVTGFADSGDSNSYWIVKEGHEDAPKLAGTVVKCGDVIRLQHLNTAKNLHSHDHRAPLNRESEVSAYHVYHDKKWAYGDVADNWVLECVSGGKDGEWQRFEQVRLKHEERGHYLSANPGLKYGDPIPNQLHVSAATRRNSNTVWKTNEGFYIAPHRPTEEDSE